MILTCEVKYLAEFGGDGAVVGMGGHEFVHVGPPALADFGAGDGFPLRGAGEFDVGEELAGFGMKKDRVGADPVLDQGAFEFGPDGTVETFVFGLGAGIHGHDEGFADGHGGIVAPSRAECYFGIRASTASRS